MHTYLKLLLSHIHNYFIKKYKSIEKFIFNKNYIKKLVGYMKLDTLNDTASGIIITLSFYMVITMGNGCNFNFFAIGLTRQIINPFSSLWINFCVKD